MNPLLSIQRRIRELLQGLPELDGATILIEDKGGLEYDIEAALAGLTAPLVLIASASGRRSVRCEGALVLEETVDVSLLMRPLTLPAGTPLPGELLVSIMCALHETPVDPEAAYLGAPYFTVTGHDLRAEDGVAIYSIAVTCPLVLTRPEPEPPPPEDVPDEALRFFARSFLDGEGADTPADAAPKDETLRGFLNGFFTGEILAAEDRLPRDEAVRTWLQQFLGTPPQQQGAST